MLARSMGWRESEGSAAARSDPVAAAAANRGIAITESAKASRSLNRQPLETIDVHAQGLLCGQNTAPSPP